MTITENINEVILRWPSRYPQAPNIWRSNSTERDRLYSNSSYCDCQTNPCLLLFPWSCVLTSGLQNHIKGVSSIKAASQATPKSSKPRRLTGRDRHVETCPQILPSVFQEHASDCLLPAKLPLDCGHGSRGNKMTLWVDASSLLALTFCKLPFNIYFQVRLTGQTPEDSG